MDNALQRKQLWAQAVEVSFSCTKTRLRCKLRGIYYENTEWLKMQSLRHCQSSRKKVALPCLETHSWASLSFSDSEQSCHYAMSWKVRRQWLSSSLHSRPMLGTDKQNSQWWGLQTFLSISSLAFAGAAKEVVSSTNSRESVREGRVWRLAMFSLWVTSAAPKIKEKV